MTFSLSDVSVSWVPTDSVCQNCDVLSAKLMVWEIKVMCAEC